MTSPFHGRFVELFDEHFHRLYRYLDRLSGDPDLAADIAQETFVRLYERGSPPDTPGAWLVTVGTNLLRNARSTRARQARLLAGARGEEVLADPPASPARAAEATDARDRVRAAIDRMPERERRLLLLRAEGYGYREIAAALRLNEASVGTLLARAKRTFRALYEGTSDAP